MTEKDPLEDLTPLEEGADLHADEEVPPETPEDEEDE